MKINSDADLWKTRRLDTIKIDFTGPAPVRIKVADRPTLPSPAPKRNYLWISMVGIVIAILVVFLIVRFLA
jgi:hypothetical protein